MNKHTLWVICWWLLWTLGSAGEVHASQSVGDAGNQTGLLLMDEESGGLLPAPLISSLIELDVTGLVARGRVRQFFDNPTEQWLSGVYVFPLPENAAVDGMRIRVGDRVLEGRIAERKQAEAIYQEAQRDGFKASLLAQGRPDRFTLAVANIGPGEEIEVELELGFEVRFVGGRFRLRCPLVVGGR